MLFYIFQIRFCFIKHVVRHFEALRFRQCQSMCDVYGQERIFVPFPVTLPKSKAAVTSLSRLQYLDIACEIFIKRFRRRHVLRFEGIQHVAHRRDRDHSRRDLFGTRIRIIRQIDERVRQFLQLCRTGCYLQPAELRIYVARRLHRLDDGSVLVRRAVCRKGLSRRRRPNR